MAEDAISMAPTAVAVATLVNLENICFLPCVAFLASFGNRSLKADHRLLPC